MKLQGWAVAGKSWTAFAGSLLAVLIPWFVTTIAPHLPEPWPALIGAAVALATAVGVYHAPYQSVTTSSGSSGSTPWPTS